MNKIYCTIPFLILMGCASLQREPASVKPTKFSFNPYGGVLPQRDFQFQLLNLEEVLNKNVKFKALQINDQQAGSEITNWQNEFKNFAQRFSVERMDFNFKNYSIVVEKRDLENLSNVLTAIDMTEADPRLQVLKKVEVITAFNEKFKTPVENKIEVLTAPLQLMSRLANPTIPVQEGSALKVPATSFWQPRSSQDVDMWNGPGKVDFGKLSHQACDYRGAKSGYGVHAGFKITCAGTKLKLKFGNEAYSGPFNSRIYHRLGFNVPAIHHVRHLQIRYDRRIFSEINSRKKQAYPVTVAGKAVVNYSRFQSYDAMEFVEAVLLKDGTVMSPVEVKKNLLKVCDQPVCDYSEANINAAFESQIESVTMVPASVTEEIGEEIGPWNYATLDHPDRTELKSLLLLGAWNGNFDLRKDNTRIVWLKETGELKHFISDPGSGFTNQSNPFFGKKGFSAMQWNVTMDTKIMEGETELPVVAVDFRGYVNHHSFHKLSFQEAQWMTRLIGSISEDEISEALAASGLSAAEFLLVREKLVAVQQDYIESFQLKKEFAQRLRKINKHLNFDPARDQVQIRLHNGSLYTFDNRGVQLKNGELIYPTP